MKIRFHITKERINDLSLDSQIALQDSSRGHEPELRGIRDAMATFMQDESGEWLPYENAISVVGRLKLKDLLGVFEQFKAAMDEYAVPKETGTSSTSPSTTGEQVPPG